ncbi:MAG: DsbA family protein [Alphaproteobacteria bacterium]|nr:DsbA family protein [Alphaproteobacteria bacterium]
MRTQSGSSKIVILVVILLIAAAGAYYFAVQKGMLPSNRAVDMLESKVDAVRESHGQFPPQPAPIQAQLDMPAQETGEPGSPSTLPESAPQSLSPESQDTQDSKDLQPQSELSPPTPAAPAATSPQSANEIRPAASSTDALDLEDSQPQDAAPLNLDKAAIDHMMQPRTLGSATAKIKVTEYSSLTCGHCADFHTKILPMIKQDYVDTGKVQFIFKEYPLNGPALVASQVLRCMPEDKFVNFMNLLFEQQKNWAYVPEYKVKLTQYAKLAGLGEAQVNACLNSVELKNALAAEIQNAEKKYSIKSTPTFVINDGEKIIVGDQPVSIYKDVFNELLNKN